jgi:hypothetical protein
VDGRVLEVLRVLGEVVLDVVVVVEMIEVVLLMANHVT